MKISENPEISGQPKISGNFGNIQKFGKPEISENLEISGIFSYLKKGTYFKKQCPLVGRSSKKIFYCFFFVFNKEKMWTSMFFIKFLGKIENVLGVASNIFNFTLEFNEKHFNPHFYPC